MRTAIQKSTAGIAALVDDNADRETPRLDSGLSSNPRFQARRHYTAIISSKLDAAHSATSQTLSQLADTLDNIDIGSGDLSAGYAAVAEAFRQAANMF